MNNELKQIKLESVYKDAYIDRYRRLGYSLEPTSPSRSMARTIRCSVFRRDRSAAQLLARLAEIEREVDELCVKAKQEQSVRRRNKAAPQGGARLRSCRSGSF